MFLGEHQHSLDAKGRVILPARFRDQLEGGAVMTKALDGCLAVFPVAEFRQRARKLQDVRGRGPIERQAVRTFFAGAVDIAPDKQGRVAIPQPLREYAALDRDVIVAGQYDHLELWDATRFRERDRVGTASIVEGEGIDDFA
jgi:transcriptional regulator MraZ